ncbi:MULTISPECIES: MFS transporter [Pandoraea]|uniref:Inner membrane protein yhjX n=1 Tax=Pandoraea pnomenusa TaxID=93220 RepID=A0A378YWR4_9BURK|nr:MULTISPECIES: MFS transporter [Pandoraea]AHB06657.1 MFS transporter [Pandoraea pnomenusa 3kgm]AHB77219.1 MFS transporter [Pandoraea pnomenusa]AHN74383.1 MFS transporter [Pandoraea pnomenusa]AIU29020.1 MFS transporter [Pandoraea pnomenusa]SUA81626.1 Inner membrane protein yhjX [Pandoraea pnomenusa]
MSNTAIPASPSLQGRVTLIILAGALVLSAAMGTRQTFGLFINPFSYDRGVPVTLVAFAIALHNLVWGFAQPFAGAMADRLGPAPVVAFGAVAFAAGLGMAALAPSGLWLVIGLGVLVGLGISCTTFGVVLPAVSRAVTPEKRTMAMGLVSAGGSLGQVALVPIAQGLRQTYGVSTSLFVLALILCCAAPLGLLMTLHRRNARMDAASANAVPAPPTAAAHHDGEHVSLREVLGQARTHRGFQLLTLGFFTCGFQLAFIATHLPGYLVMCHMPIGLGATALALIGLFNMLGSWACGWLGGRYRQHHVLGWLYLLRGAAIALFFLLPKTDASVVIFAAVMGLTWLGTVPLTSGLVAKVFGTRHLGTLFGVCFMSHQVGSFLGAWLGGYVLDVTGSYNLIWAVTAILGAAAAALHFPIDDASVVPPIPRAVPASA